MNSITFENSTQHMTLEDAIFLYDKYGISTIINDGKDVTFEIEAVSTSEESTRRN